MNRAISFVLALGVVGCSADPAPITGPNLPVNMMNQQPMQPVQNNTAGSMAPVMPPPAVNNNTAGSPAPMTTAGTTAPPMMTAGAGGAGGSTGMMTDPNKPMLAMDECKLDTMYPGDEFCINPPPADKGFQMHIGPSDYNNPGAQFILEPGREVTENFNATSGNDKMVYYYYRQYRMRPGTHHLIVNQGIGRRLGGSTSSAKDNPQSGIIAPENMDVGMPLPARTQLSNSLHYYNFTNKPILKEVWVNFWYRNAEDVKRPATEVFSMAPMGVAPGQHVVISGSCPISGSGHALTLYPHVHANNNRFAAYRVRGGQRTTILESFDWEHPYLAEYSSLVQNPMPNRAMKQEGAFSGVLDLMSGDTIEFECEITNNTTNFFVGQNEAKDDEMCILVGDTVGASIPPLCTYNTQTL